MPESEQVDATTRERLIAELADHLCRTGVLPWPGTDGMTLDEVVLAAMRDQSADGELPTLTELLAHFPALAQHPHK